MYTLLLTGVFYFMLGNLHPKYRSRYASIQLVSICKRKHITTYSMNEVLKPFIEDVKKLVSVPNVQKSIFIGCILFCL